MGAYIGKHIKEVIGLIVEGRRNGWTREEMVIKATHNELYHLLVERSQMDNRNLQKAHTHHIEAALRAMNVNSEHFIFGVKVVMKSDRPVKFYNPGCPGCED